jgi:carbon-monoxide dehydrogenase large subunit
MPHVTIGKSVPRLDVIEKVTGHAVFTADLELPRMLVGKVLRSTVPHARLKSIDVSRAARLPGVKAVVTGKDFPYTYNLALRDQPFLAIDRVRYIGEPVAAVAAVDADTAQAALALIRVEYEELPALFDPFEAMRPEALLIHPDLGSYRHEPAFKPVPGTNICNHFKLRKGDVERGFAESDEIVEGSYYSHAIQHCALEPHAAVAQFDDSGRLFVSGTNQPPWFAVADLSLALGLPITKIRVQSPYLGGGFGGKHGLKSEPVAIALASRTRGRPVKVVYTREEVFTSTVLRGPVHTWIKSGVKRDGTLVARQTRVVWDTGGYADVGPLLCRNASYASTGPYVIPHQRIDGYCVYTNKPLSGAFRGYGVMEVGWAFESHTDVIAERLGLDRLEFRLRNALEEGSLSSTGQRLHSVGLKEALSRAAEAIGWKEGAPGDGGRRGKSIVCTYKQSHAPTTSSAFVKINDDGTVTLMTSTTEIGQGSKTVMAQIVAEELGVPLDTIDVVMADTSVTPPDRSTTSSRSTYHMGNAVRLAAVDARTRLLQAAADRLEASPDDLEIRDGRIAVRGVPDRSLAIRDAVAPRPGGRFGPVLGQGSFIPGGTTGLDLETGQGGRVTSFWMFSAQAAEVAVDVETGRIDVLKFVSAHDVGKALHPQSCEGQIEGGVVTGLGSALMEEVKVVDGRVVNPQFGGYRLPTACDVPPVVPILVEVPHEEGPYGAKGMGEAPTTGVAPAIGNAVAAAVGVRLTELPLTPEKVLRALRDKDGPPRG